MKLSDIRFNSNNPRTIDDEKFEKLKKSIENFPKMLQLRPLIVNNDNIVLGGNMRLKALNELGYKEIPDNWVKKADELTEDEQHRFIIVDNIGFGVWDWELIDANWDSEDLTSWGLDLPEFEKNTKKEKKTYDLKGYKKSHILISFNPDNFGEIKEIIKPLFEIDFVEILQSSN